MTPQQLVALGLRIFSIFLFFYMLKETVPYLLEIFHGTGFDYPFWGTGAVFIMTIVACLLLWFFPLTVAGKILPKELNQPEYGIGYEQIAVLAFMVLGIWLLIVALPDAGQIATYWLAFMQTNSGIEGMRLQLLGLTVASAIKVVIGLWLMLGATGLKNLLFRLRNLGVEE